MEARESSHLEASVFLEELNARLGSTELLASVPFQGKTETRRVGYLIRRLRALRYEKVSLRLELRAVKQELAKATRQAELSIARIMLNRLLRVACWLQTWRLRHRLRAVLSALRPWARSRTMETPAASSRELAVTLARVALRSFLETKAHLDFAPCSPPQVSILLLLCNRAELTLACLESLALRLNQTPFEIIAVDNGSTDETGLLLERARGLKIIRNEVNVGFPKGVNQAAQLASGKYLLLLNNDTKVLGRSLDVAADFLEANADVGAVGGKIVWLDGTLQEGGGTLCQDGRVWQYGTHGAPGDPAYNFQRDVDYCSGAFLMTPRELFAQLGGLDEAFSPGYFEDPDYCVRLQQEGRRVVYLPNAAILHHETATSSAACNRHELLLRNHKLFAAKQAGWLRTRPMSTWPDLFVRTSGEFRFSVLLLGDGLVKDLPVEQALTTMSQLIASVQEIGGFVTLGITGTTTRRLGPVLDRLPKTVEILRVEETGQAVESLASRATDYDLVMAGDAALPGFLTARTPGLPPCAFFQNGRFELQKPWGTSAPPAGLTTKAA